MDQTSLVAEQIEAGSAFLSELEKYAPIRVAYWLKEEGDGDWNLYIASDRIDDSNIELAYGEVVRIVNRNPNPYLDPFQIKFIWGNQPTVRAARELRQRFPGPMPIRYGQRGFGGLRVDGVYIYPATTTTANI